MMRDRSNRGAGRRDSSNGDRPSAALAFTQLGVSLAVILVCGTILSIGFLLSLLAGATVAAVVGMIGKFTWASIERGILATLYRGLIAVVILLLVGILIGVWIASGTVPFVLYWGLEILSPATFLVGAFVVCALFALGNGSSFATIGSAGVALMGVGLAMGYPAGLTAGAIIGGTFVGDKASPVSDTTVTAASITRIDLFRHIHSLLYITIPASAICLVIYGVIGATHAGGGTPEQVTAVLGVLQANFSLSPLTLLPPLLLIALAIRRCPALPTITIAIIAGGLVAVLVEGIPPMQVLQIATGGFQAGTGDALVDSLLTLGGMESMFSTVALLLCALIYGGVLEGTNSISVIIDRLIRWVRGTGSLIVSVLASCWVMLIGTGNTYVTIIVPGRAYLGTFRRMRISPSVLSRTLEDGGTIASSFLPWSLTAVFIATTLRVPTTTYAPYAFFLYIVPLLSIIYGFTGFAIFRDDDGPESGQEAGIPEQEDRETGSPPSYANPPT